MADCRAEGRKTQDEFEKLRVSKSKKELKK